MKNKCFLIAFTTMFLHTSVFAADIRIVTEGAYAPWNYIDDNGNAAGFEIDLGNEICNRIDASCEWVLNEWDSIIPNLLAGNYDAIMAAMSITVERQQTIEFSSEYFPPDPARFVAAKGANIDFDNLKGMKMGVQGATIHSAYLEEQYQEGNSILKYETADQSVADLSAGNIDMLLADGPYLELVVNGSDGAFMFVGPKLEIGGGVGIGMRKDDTELHDKMQAALDSIKSDGTLDALIMKFFEKGPFFQ